MHEEMSADNLYFRFFSLSRQCRNARRRAAAVPPGPTTWRCSPGSATGLVGVASYEPTAGRASPRSPSPCPTRCTAAAIATLLLEHLVSIASARRLTAFTAETLPDNLAMLRVFADAGLPVQRRFDRWRDRADHAAAGGEATSSTATWTR